MLVAQVIKHDAKVLDPLTRANLQFLALHSGVLAISSTLLGQMGVLGEGLTAP